MIRWCHLAGLTGVLLAAPSAFAQPEPSSADAAERDIVVTGELPPKGQITRQAREITVPTGIHEKPLPLFADALCPGVLGLRSDYSAVIVGRIRGHAERFGLDLTADDGTCSPNFVVAFVDDGKAEMQEIAEEQYRLFRGMQRRDRLELLAEDGAARAWMATEMRTRDGVPLAVDVDSGTQEVLGWNPASRIQTPVREDILFVVVLINRAAAPGKTLQQLADYATMRGLARTRPVEADGARVETILALFDPNARPPAEMTAFDSAYLGAIYSGSPAMPGLGKVVAVSSEMRRQAVAALAEGPAAAVEQP